jgi:hypothetical protein
MLFVTDATTVQLYEQIFQRVARVRRQVTFPIRCDSPEFRRHLDLTIAALPTGKFAVWTSLVRFESRRRVDLSRGGTRHKGTIVMCGWCKRVDVEGKWVEVEDAMVTLRLFERPIQPLLQHGICRDCHRRMLTLLDELVNLPEE